jgi:hypothetical protein
MPAILEHYHSKWTGLAWNSSRIQFFRSEWVARVNPLWGLLLALLSQLELEVTKAWLRVVNKNSTANQAIWYTDSLLCRTHSLQGHLEEFSSPSPSLGLCVLQYRWISRSSAIIRAAGCVLLCFRMTTSCPPKQQQQQQQNNQQNAANTTCNIDYPLCQAWQRKHRNFVVYITQLITPAHRVAPLIMGKKMNWQHNANGIYLLLHVKDATRII